MRLHACLLLLTLTSVDAFLIRRQSHDGQDVPAGWRLATAEDARLNEAHFHLVLKKWDIASLKGEKKANGWGYAEKVIVKKPDDWQSLFRLFRGCFTGFQGFPRTGLVEEKRHNEALGHQVIVNFEEGTVLKGERIERIVRRTDRVAFSAFCFAWPALTLLSLMAVVPKTVTTSCLVLDGIMALIWAPIKLRSTWHQTRGAF